MNIHEFQWKKKKTLSFYKSKGVWKSYFGQGWTQMVYSPAFAKLYATQS